jgi:hypothetical protein
MSESGGWVDHIPLVAWQFLPFEDRPCRAINALGPFALVAANKERAWTNVARLVANWGAARAISPRVPKKLSSPFLRFRGCHAIPEMMHEVTRLFDRDAGP